MKTLSINKANDLHAVNGRLAIATGIDAVSQTCMRAVKSQMSEMPFAYDKGVNYKDFVFGQSPRWNSFKSACEKQILGVNGVRSIQAFNIAFKDGVIAYEAFIETIYGSTSITDLLDPK